MKTSSLNYNGAKYQPVASSHLACKYWKVRERIIYNEE